MADGLARSPSSLLLEVVDPAHSPTVRSDRRAHVLPIHGWDRFEILDFVGSGAMGRVFKARDLRLKRTVALKFIRGADARLAERLVHEAQAQARVGHDNVCQVYEVGNVAGETYVAMQYVDGPTLHEARSRLNVEEIARILAAVASAIHAAHRIGLIHRDIKPSNIMLERTEGGWRPYVLDFGLARELEDDGGARTASIVGTPSYMAPEQASRDVQRLDRRTDVHGLGATLYDLLVGQPPFVGKTQIDTIWKVVHDEPDPPRRIRRQIPVDLETIVLKCLQKDPDQRYDTAKALAEDLSRYLDGEPICARPTSWAYRARKKLVKHSLLAAIGSVAALAVVGLVLVGAQARRSATEKARAAQELGQEVERIDELSRYMYLLPLHDTRQEKAAIRERIGRLQSRIQSTGSIGRGAGHFALGRAYAALHEYAAARRELEEAWNAGQKTAETAWALGQVLGALYQEALDQAERLNNAELRESRRQEVERQYRATVVKYLGLSSGTDSVQRELADGLLALYEKNYALALVKADQALERSPALVQARRLAADAYLGLGADSSLHGHYDDARSQFEHAGDAYRRAAVAAPSDARLYLGDCERFLRVMQIDEAQGRSPSDNSTAALGACDLALVADPGSAEAFIKKSSVFATLALYQDGHSIDPRPAVEKAVEMAQLALRTGTPSAEAYLNMSAAYMRKGTYEHNHGLDPRWTFNEAVHAAERALAIDPTLAAAHNSVGRIWCAQAWYEAGLNIDIRPTLNRAIESFRRTLQLTPNSAYTYSNLALSLVQRSEYEASVGENPIPTIDAAIETYQKALEINPNYALAHNNLCHAYFYKADFDLSAGIDPTTALERGLASCTRASELNPRMPNAKKNLSRILRSRARLAWYAGRDGSADADRAVTLMTELIAEDPERAEYHADLGESLRVRALVGLGRHERVAELLDRSIAAFRRANAIDVASAPDHADRARANLLAARLAIKDGRSPERYFTDALAALQRALVLDPNSAKTHLTMAILHRWQAAWKARTGQAGKAELEQALAEVDRALLRNARLAEAHLIRADLWRLEGRPQEEVQATMSRSFALNSYLRRLAERDDGLATLTGPSGHPF